MILLKSLQQRDPKNESVKALMEEIRVFLIKEEEQKRDSINFLEKI